MRHIETYYINEDLELETVRIKKKLASRFKDLQTTLEKYPRKRMITAVVSEHINKCCIAMVKTGIYPSRAEIIRRALREFLEREYIFLRASGYLED